MKLIALLPIDRALEGTIRLLAEDNTELGRWPCRGKADSTKAMQNHNPRRDPALPYGDTPSGEYLPAKVAHLDPPHETLGGLIIPLEGCAGDALMAHQNGRTGLAIHANRGNDRLVATHGCLRMYDRDLARLAELLDTSKASIEILDLGGGQ